MELSKEQQTAAEFIGLLSVYPTSIPTGAKDGNGTDLRASMDEDLHEFAKALGVASDVAWHDPEDEQSKQVAIDHETLTGIQAATAALYSLVERTPIDRGEPRD